MPRHATKTSFVKGDPRLVGKGKSSEAIAKTRATNKLRHPGIVGFFCDWCGAKAKMNLYRFEHQKFHFCGRACSNKWRSVAVKNRVIAQNLPTTFSPEARSLSAKAQWALKTSEEKVAWTKEMRDAQRHAMSYPEKRLLRIIEENSLPYRYTGDGKFWIERFNPDFINCNGKKVLVEVFGDYWHKLSDRQKHDARRSEVFASYGWHEVIFWESDLKKLSDEEILDNLRTIDCADA